MAQFGGIGGLGAPINYYDMIPDFRREALQETQNQLGIAQLQQQRAQAAAQQQQMQQMRSFQAELPGAINDPQKLQELAVKYPTQVGAIKDQLQFRNEQDVAAVSSATGDLQTAAQVGPEAVAQAIVKHASTIQQKGVAPQQLMQLYVNDPSQFNNFLGSVKLGALSAKDQFAVQNDQQKNALTARGQDMTAETARRGQDISAATAQRGQNLSYGSAMTGHNLASQRLALDQQEFAFKQQQADEKKQELITGAPKLSVNMEKGISQAVDDSTASTNSANSMSSLADQFLKENPTTGIFGNANNMFARITGSDTALRDLRIRQNALINSQVLKFLPPGPATDRDVEIVRQGAPTDMDNPKIVARWLNSMANMERRNAQFNEFKAEWMSANGNPGQSRNGGQILGMDVNKGESLGQAAKRYMSQNPIGNSPAQSASESTQGAQTSASAGETYTSKSGIKFKVE